MSWPRVELPRVAFWLLLAAYTIAASTALIRLATKRFDGDPNWLLVGVDVLIVVAGIAFFAVARPPQKP